MQNALNAIFGNGQSGKRNITAPQRSGDAAGGRADVMRGGDSGQFAPPEGALREGSFYNEQIQLFQKRTAEFLRQSFPSFAKTLTEPEQEKLAINVQKRAGLRGFTTEKEIWHYLIAVIYCGFLFEQDPQYADMLRLVGWQNAEANRALLLDRLLNVIEEYSYECEQDFADFDKKLTYLGEFYADSNFSNAVISALPAEEQAALARQMLETIFPARAALWSDEARRNLIGASLDQAQRLGFRAKEGLLYCIAAVYFGRGFEQSPLYPWAYFLSNRNIPAQDRIKQFISAVAKHMRILAE